jgi:hypothetical protein
LVPIEALNLLYVIDEYLFDVWLLRKDRAIKVCTMYHQNFLVYQLPNEVHPKREIKIGRTWSQFEAPYLLYVIEEYLFDVWLLRKDRAIKVCTMYNQHFLVYQLPNEVNPKREIKIGRTWSQLKLLISST